MIKLRGYDMTKSYAVAFALCIFTLTGCRGPWVARNSRQNMPADALNAVVVMDAGLRSWRPFVDMFGAALTVDRNIMHAMEGGGIEVSVEFKNNRSADQHFQVQTVFRDGEGVMLSDQSNWEHIIIPRRSSYLYRCRSMSKEARNYNVRVRKSSN